MESSLKFHHKMKIELLYNPEIPHLDISWKKIKTLTENDIYMNMFIAALFTIAKI